MQQWRLGAGIGLDSEFFPNLLCPTEQTKLSLNMDDQQKFNKHHSKSHPAQYSLMQRLAKGS